MFLKENLFVRGKTLEVKLKLEVDFEMEIVLQFNIKASLKHVQAQGSFLI